MGKDLEMLRELSLAEQLGRLHRLWRTVADLELAPLGLTHPRWTALWKLSRLGGHLSQKTLAEALERMWRERGGSTEGIAAEMHHGHSAVDELEPPALMKS